MTVENGHVTDAEVVEVGTEIVAAPPVALFQADSPAEVVTRATEVADVLRDVLKRQGLTQNIQGKDHVRVEGWQLAGALLGVTAICVDTETLPNGYKATVEARTADGRVVGRADALCTKDEKRGPWKTADDYARLSMAQTRATSKALKGPLGFVVSLAGYATTPAEEMAGVPRPAPVSPPTSKKLTDAQQERVILAIEAADQPVDLTLRAVGVDDAGDLTVADAKAIKELIS